METIRLGTTDLQVSRVGFGGIPIQRLQTDVIDIWQFHGVSTP
jgi:aryl-alcohol dehydrogenase-like predicted oxidoreductase